MCIVDAHLFFSQSTVLYIQCGSLESIISHRLCVDHTSLFFSLPDRPPKCSVYLTSASVKIMPTNRTIHTRPNRTAQTMHVGSRGWIPYTCARRLGARACAHMGETPSVSRRSKIQPFLDLLIPLFQQHLNPSQELSIDEAMIAFRGRVSFRQYIRGKPQPWGIKAYVLSESRTGYMYNLVIYYGKETQLIMRPGLNHTTAVVLTLIDPLKNLGYDLYTDRFYTSPLLAEELLQIRTTLTGTVMSNRKNMPAAVKKTSKRREMLPHTQTRRWWLCNGQINGQSLH